MLINLSNHPSHLWSEAQRQAAISKYHEIVDLPFPQIDPEAGILSISELVEDYTAKCLNLLEFTDELDFDSLNNAVHVMGEMTFTYNIVQKLEQKGVPCFASTTKRIVKEEGGIKTSVFEFVQFRHYNLEWEFPF